MVLPQQPTFQSARRVTLPTRTRTHLLYAGISTLSHQLLTTHQLLRITYNYGAPHPRPASVPMPSPPPPFDTTHPASHPTPQHILAPTPPHLCRSWLTFRRYNTSTPFAVFIVSVTDCASAFVAVAAIPAEGRCSTYHLLLHTISYARHLLPDTTSYIHLAS